VFGSAGLAVYVDGCFWHGCPVHKEIPASNRDFWLRKLERNMQRDSDVAKALEAHGWQVIRVWEHDVMGPGTDLAEVADRIETVVRASQDRSAT